MSLHLSKIKKTMLLIEIKLFFGIRYLPEIQMLRATNNCGLNFYGEKMILGIQKTGSIHQSQMADVLKPPSAGRIS